MQVVRTLVKQFGHVNYMRGNHPTERVNEFEVQA